MSLHIRSMTPADYPAVDAMMSSLHQLHVDARPDLYRAVAHIYPEEMFLEKIADPNMICLIAEADGSPAGLCFVEMRFRTCMQKMVSAYMDDLYVCPEHRRRGVATGIFREAERLARARGAVRLDLMVWAFNAEAIRFYESLGMTLQRAIYEMPLKEDNA